MEQKTVHSSEQVRATIAPAPTEATTRRSEADRRVSFGTAKTENLRDSGLWRFFWNAAIIVASLLVVVFPLFMLIYLLVSTVTAGGDAATVSAHQVLAWVWVVMIVLEMGLAALIVRYLTKVLLGQPGNYR